MMMMMMRIRNDEVFQMAKEEYYLLTYLLTPWCRVFLENLTGLQLVTVYSQYDILLG